MYRILDPGEEVAFEIPVVISKVIEVRDRSLVCTELNVHYKNPELFACLDGKDWAFWACRDPDLGRPEFIKLRPHQLFLVEPGTRHFGPLVLVGRVGKFQLTTGPNVAEEDTEVTPTTQPFTPPTYKR